MVGSLNIRVSLFVSYDADVILDQSDPGYLQTGLTLPLSELQYDAAKWLYPTLSVRSGS
jgi:hypothetical protein